MEIKNIYVIYVENILKLHEALVRIAMIFMVVEKESSPSNSIIHFPLDCLCITFYVPNMLAS